MALAEECSMSGDIELRIDRRPDFFALNELEGRWRLAVAEREAQIVGCICVSEREAYFDGLPRTTGYVGDLKVHPEHRDMAIADALSLYAKERVRALDGNAPVLITVLRGNAAMQRRLRGPRGLPSFTRVATVRTHSLTILWKRKTRSANDGGVEIRPATWADVEEMADLWRTVAPGRQLAPVHDAESLAFWIRDAPGLDITDYRLAHGSNGRLVGFLGLWNQNEFKQMSVVSYSRRMAAARRVFNAITPIVGAERLPEPGRQLDVVTAVNICVPPTRPNVLRSLIVCAHNELRHSVCSVLNIGLDTKDPLSSALDGLFAQPTDVNAYL
jgi:ribosomal protein S18 acetylase RimI-like enzyme